MGSMSVFILCLHRISCEGARDSLWDVPDEYHYEDQMHKIADFEKGAFKGRFALLNGQCEGHISYMAIVTYYHGGVKTTFLHDERIQKMKHVQVGEVLANQKGGVYLKIIFPNGTDWTGRGKLSLRQKIKSRSEIRIFLCMWKVYEPYTAAL